MLPPGEVDDGLGPQAAHHGHLLVNAQSPGGEVGAHALVLDLVPADADAQAEPASRQKVDFGRLLGHQHRLSLREHEHTGD